MFFALALHEMPPITGVEGICQATATDLADFGRLVLLGPDLLRSSLTLADLPSLKTPYCGLNNFQILFT